MNKEKYGIASVEYEITDSTNERAKVYAAGEWDGEPTLFIAEEQTKGRGRYSRKFHSKSGKGAYLSLLFKPKSGINDTTSIIALAAISMIRAITEQVSADVKIKWVNDLILGDRKLGGILIEGAIDPLTRSYNYLIAGIGVNLYKTDFDKEIENIATSLEGECSMKIDKTRLVRSFVKHFLEEIKSPDSDELFIAYRERLITVGKAVTVKTVTEEYEATALCLNRDYSLSVITEGGEEKRIYTGEVSVKAK
jgi:BirA family biotin operon repressor/biotin-[acetyl-CoA-carboxylase] ligase